jgi:hypothetical protein
MATPHADFQDFRCSDGSGNPKTVKRFGYVGLMTLPLPGKGSQGNGVMVLLAEFHKSFAEKGLAPKHLSARALPSRPAVLCRAPPSRRTPHASRRRVTWHSR